MEKEDDIDNTAPSLGDTPPPAAVDLGNITTSTTAANIQDAVDTETSPPSTTPTKSRHPSYSNSKWRSLTSPSTLSPLKSKPTKKKRETAKHSYNNNNKPHGQKAQGRRKSNNKSAKALKNVTNVKEPLPSLSSSASPVKGLSLDAKLLKEVDTKPSGKSDAKFKITSRIIVQPLRRDTFGGKTIASENVYDSNDIEAHDVPFMKAALNKFGLDKVDLPNVNEGYLTNNFSQLSRLILEDMLTQYNADDEQISFRVLVSQPTKSSDEQIRHSDAYISKIQSLASTIYWHQKRCGGLGVQKHEIMQTKYNELYVTLVPNGNHKSIKEGQLSLDEIKRLIEGDEGFELSYKDGTSSMPGDNRLMKIRWRDLFDYPSDIMIFGRQSRTIRSFSSLFIDKPKVDYIHHIHRQFAQEVLGDAVQSLALIAAYESKRRIVSTENEKISNEKSEKSLMLSMNFLGHEQSAFFKKVDDTFKGAIETSLANYQNYKDPIVSNDKMIEFMEEAQQLFPYIWTALANMRGINADWSRGNHLVVSKQKQVFYQLMSQARQADPRRLVHWAFVESLASYGHGIGKKPQNLSSYWGYTASTSTRDDMMKELGKDLQQRTTKALQQQKSSLLCFDNIQRGQPKLYQRGEKSSFYVSRTHQVANLVEEYDDTTYDGNYVEMTYDQHQAIPSPSNFPAFEEIDQTSVNELIGVFTNFD